MTAVARIALQRVPAREAEVAPKKLRDDSPRREFGEDLAEEQKAPQIPTAEQLALAGVMVPQIERPVPPVQAVPIDVAVAQLEQAAPRLVLIPEISVDTPVDSSDSEELPATPLEQAVLDLLDRHDSPEIVVTKLEIARDVPSPKIAEAAPVTPPRELPEQTSPTSHVNLVMDDGDRRIVMTVAVRGTDVNVQLRGGDDIAAGLARNAASLDEAMRMRGLSLAEFTTSRDPETHERERPQHERREQPQERFTLEENR